MLTKRQARWTFFFLRQCAKLNILPIKVDEKSGTIYWQDKRWRVVLWYVYYSLKIMHTVFLLFGLIWIRVEPVNECKVHHVALQLFWASQSGFISYSTFVLFIRYRDETLLVFNEFYKQNDTEPQDEEEKENEDKTDGEEEKEGGKDPEEDTGPSSEEKEPEETGEVAQEAKGQPWKFLKIFDYRLKDLMALSLPWVVACGVILAWIIILIDPTQRVLLYSAVPEKYQIWSIFFILMPLELLFLLLPGVVFLFSCFSQLGFVERSNIAFHSLMNRLRDVKDEKLDSFFMGEILKQQRELQVYIHFFNLSYSSVIFCFKIIALGYPIAGVSFAIKYNKEHPIVSAFVLYAAIVVALSYVLLYGSGCNFKENSRNLKGQMRFQSRISTINKYPRQQDNVATLQRQIFAIHETGIRVGNFHTLERMTTPNYFHFIVSKVVDVLLGL